MIKLLLENNLSKSIDAEKQSEKVEIRIGRVDSLPMDLSSTQEITNEQQTDIGRGTGEEGSQPEQPTLDERQGVSTESV